MEYSIHRAVEQPSLTGQWLEPAWRNVPVATLRHFVKRSSSHHPQVEAKLTYTPESLYVFFRVHDRYVRCVQTEYQSGVCRDSCVELFIQPQPDKGYFNFEINCGGTMLLYYIEDPRKGPNGFQKSTMVPWDLAKSVQIFHSMPAVVDPEITEPVEWTLEYRIPLALFATYVGARGELSGKQWRGNLYKCADQTSHPHWASWAPLGENLNFHVPECFAPMRFQ